MKIAWTTTETKEQAESLAHQCVESHRAACVQISSPITSVYRWQGEVESSQEYRLTFKFNDSQLESLKQWILTNHPYDTPQWVVVDASDVSEAYQSWAEG